MKSDKWVFKAPREGDSQIEVTSESFCNEPLKGKFYLVLWPWLKFGIFSPRGTKLKPEHQLSFSQFLTAINVIALKSFFPD